MGRPGSTQTWQSCTQRSRLQRKHCKQTAMQNLHPRAATGSPTQAWLMFPPVLRTTTLRPCRRSSTGELQRKTNDRIPHVTCALLAPDALGWLRVVGKGSSLAIGLEVEERHLGADFSCVDRLRGLTSKTELGLVFLRCESSTLPTQGQISLPLCLHLTVSITS